MDERRHRNYTHSLSQRIAMRNMNMIWWKTELITSPQPIICAYKRFRHPSSVAIPVSFPLHSDESVVHPTHLSSSLFAALPALRQGFGWWLGGCAILEFNKFETMENGKEKKRVECSIEYVDPTDPDPSLFTLLPVLRELESSPRSALNRNVSSYKHIHKYINKILLEQGI